MTTTCFPGFRPPTGNTTYTPNQFFDVVLRHGSRGAVRLVAYLLRQTLGWCDAEGQPRESQVTASYRELEERAGIGHSSIAEAVQECLDARYIVQVQAGKPDTAGSPARSACYALCWDERDAYVTDPVVFQGFFAGNGNLTYIPNQFFDQLVPHETLAMLKVVGIIIRHTIGFQTRYGFRRQQVQLSMRDLERLTNLSHDSARLALLAARAKGYVVRVVEGCFDPAGGQESRAAVYGVRWQDGFGDRSENQHEAADRNPAREPTENQHGDRSENRPGIEITGNNTSEKQQQTEPAAAAEELRDQIKTIAERLEQFGFDHATAQQLAAAHDHERINRQCDWLARRNPRSNTLGLLRRAIEEDWPEPKGDLPATPAVVFAANFYAGWAGVRGATLTRPSANDIAAAEPYISRLLQLVDDERHAITWGREFGAFARYAEVKERDALCSCVHALRLHGDAFCERVTERCEKTARLALVQSRREHQERHQGAYERYLRDEEQRLRRDHPEAFAAFVQHEQRQRDFIRQSKLSQKSLAAFNQEANYLDRLCLWFTADEDAAARVLSFWGWDETHNPEPFSELAKQPVLVQRRRVTG